MRDSWADYYGLSDPPKVDTIRFIGTEEVDAVHRDCLVEAGFERDAVGLISVPEGQETTLALAEYTCRVQYPVPEKYAQEWTAEQVQTQYVWTVEFVMPCLEEAGHPTSDAPSESVFVETWESDPFFPFSQVRIDVSAEQYNAAWETLEARCPQIAPGEVLWEGVEIAEWAASAGRP